MKSHFLSVAAAATVFGLLACGTSTAPDAGITQADVNQLANDVDALSVTTLGDAGASPFAPSFSVSASDLTPRAAVTAVSRSFTKTHACPAGGSVTVVGSTTGTSDPVAHNLSVTTTATMTDVACAFNSRNGLLILTGNPNVTITNTINVVAGKPVGPQTQTHVGSVTWTRGTKSGTCNVNVTSVFDPTAGTFTVTGTLCSRTLHVSRSAPTG